MNNINDLLSIGRNTIQKKTQLSNVNSNQDFNGSFADLLVKNNNKPYVSNPINSNTTNVSVYTISKDSLTKDGKDILTKLNNFLSTESNIDTIQSTLKKINSILNKSTNNNSLQNLSTLDSVESMDDIINFADILSLEELDDSDESTLESIQSILALLNQQYNLNNIELDSSTSFGENLDTEAISSNNELFDTISSIENKITDILDENSFADNSEVVDDFMQKLISLLQSENEVSRETDSSKKEEMFEISNNLDISSVFNPNVNTIDVIEITGNEDINPIVKQVLSSIQAQISTLDLDNKTVELRLKLFPSKLGSISVILEHDSNGLKITLLSDNPDVRTILSESIGDLKHQLNKFENEVSVDVSSNQENNNKEQNSKNTEGIQYFNNYTEEVLLKTNSDINLINRILDIKV